MNLKKSLIISIILMGVTAIVSQIVFMREFLVIFYGSEMSIGIIFAGWLVWGAVGSWFLGRFSDSVKKSASFFSLCQLFLSFILPGTLFLIRLSKIAIGLTQGEIIGYVPMFLTVFVILFLPCTMMGFMFSLACRAYRDNTSYCQESAGRVYFTETLGALFGGFFVTFFIVQRFQPFDIMFFLFFFNILAAIMLWFSIRTPSKAKSKVYCLIASFFVLWTLVAVMGNSRFLEKYSLNCLWKHFDIVESKNSIYGNIAVTKTGKGVSFYENGLHLYTVPDSLSSEEAAHYGLLESIKPERVLLIGGGAGGLLEEILKHPVKKIDYVELDPVLIKLAKKHLDKKYTDIFTRSEVNIINVDGRFFVKNSAERYDAAIINLGDPHTAQLNRFYTVEFFKELKRILNENAVVSFSLLASANYISRDQKKYLKSMYLTVREVFPDCIIIPGDRAVFVASNKEGNLTYDYKILLERLKERNIKTEYVREYYLSDKLSPSRVSYVKDMIEESAGKIDANHDFKPVLYYYASVFWSTFFDAPLSRKIFNFFSPKMAWFLTALICIFILGFSLYSRIRTAKNIILVSIMTTGFTGINFQIVNLLAFQVIYGYVFYKLGVIITSFMAGLALGSWVVLKRARYVKNEARFFLRIQMALAVYPLIMPLVFILFSDLKFSAISWIGSKIVFPFISVIAGILGGIHFPLANKLYLGDSEKVGRIGGLNYGLDLTGACLGAFFTTAFLIPVLGLIQTSLLSALINAVVYIALAGTLVRFINQV